MQKHDFRKTLEEIKKKNQSLYPTKLSDIEAGQVYKGKEATDVYHVTIRILNVRESGLKPIEAEVQGSFDTRFPEVTELSFKNFIDLLGQYSATLMEGQYPVGSFMYELERL